MDAALETGVLLVADGMAVDGAGVILGDGITAAGAGAAGLDAAVPLVAPCFIDCTAAAGAS